MDSRDCLNTPIRYNHIGYVPKGNKVFFLEPSRLGLCEDDMSQVYFRVVDVSGLRNYKGQFKCGTFENFEICDYSGEKLWSGDFSEVKDAGVYQILVCKGETVLFESHCFEITDGWILQQLKANIKSFYFQRSGVALTEKFASKWARPAAHFDDCIRFHHSMNREGSWNAHGGWYDAGDYGKYIVNGGISVGTLLLACEMWNNQQKEKTQNLDDIVHAGGSFELPYSLMDEIRFELDFFLKMQDVDGGVFFKVTPEHWDGFISPSDSDLLQKRLILGKSTTSTLNFAAALAQASSVFRYTDEVFADLCLNASLRAYGWAVANPDVTWPHNTEGSGGYGDERYDDEFFWARAALFCALSQVQRNSSDLECIRSLIPGDMEKNPAAFGMDWRDTQNMGWILLALQDYDEHLRDCARKTLEQKASEIMDQQKQDPYGLSIRRFIWGSNGEVSNHALTLLIVRSWKSGGDRDVLLNWSLNLVDFIYGRNPVNTCFVTGAAWSSPKNPHHRLSHSDGVDDPIPGLVVGGLNCDRQDKHRAPHYPSELPGHSYTDERCSFASNETAINWSAPLTAVLLLLYCR